MIFFPFERPEPDGAEGQPGSLAIGNTMIVLPHADFAQVQSHVILHRIKLHNAGVCHANHRRRMESVAVPGLP